MKLALLLLIAHLLADFTFQTNRMAQLKRRRLKPFLQHLSVHALLNLLVLGFAMYRGMPLGTAAWLFGLILSTHALIDRSNLKRIGAAAGFWLDQALHIGLIFGSVYLFTPYTWPENYTLDFKVIWVCVWILVAAELFGRGISPLLAPLAPRAIESHFERKVTRTEKFDSGKRHVTHEVEDQARSYSAEVDGVGRYIGLAERLIIMTLVAVDAVGAIGFVIALKALARFKQFDDRRFAEYYIIGSLVSILAALLCGVALKTIF